MSDGDDDDPYLLEVAAIREALQVMAHNSAAAVELAAQQNALLEQQSQILASINEALWEEEGEAVEGDACEVEGEPAHG